MKCTENKVRCAWLHNDLLKHDPWGDVDGVSFIGRLVLDEELSEDQENVSVYAFNVDSLIDDFIESYTGLDNGKMKGIGQQKAEMIIANLNRMIKKIELHL